MKAETKKQRFSRIHLLEEFNALPDSAWFGQETVAAVRYCSEATIERERWSGGGVPFVKCGRSIRYSKRSILEWLAKHKLLCSTTEINTSSRDGL